MPTATTIVNRRMLKYRAINLVLVWEFLRQLESKTNYVLDSGCRIFTDAIPSRDSIRHGYKT